MFFIKLCLGYCIFLSRLYHRQTRSKDLVPLLLPERVPYEGIPP